MQRILLGLILLCGCLTAAGAQNTAARRAQAARDSLRWEQVLDAYQAFCDIAVEARSGEPEAIGRLRTQADAITALLQQVKGSRMTASQQKRFERMKQRYDNVVMLPDLPAAPFPAPSLPVQPVQVVQGQTVVIRDTVFVVREVRQIDTVRVVEQVDKIVEVPVERIVEVPVETRKMPAEDASVSTTDPVKQRASYLLLGQAVAPDFSYGAMLGVMRKAGFYVRFDSNFRWRTADYSCTSAGQASYGQIWTTGHSERSRLTVAGGLLLHPLPWLTAYAGAGYGERSLYWEDISGRWAQVSDVSCRSFSADIGLIFNLDHLAISAGLTTIGFSRLDATLGLGFIF